MGIVDTTRNKMQLIELLRRLNHDGELQQDVISHFAQREMEDVNGFVEDMIAFGARNKVILTATEINEVFNDLRKLVNIGDQATIEESEMISGGVWLRMQSLRLPKDSEVAPEN